MPGFASQYAMEIGCSWTRIPPGVNSIW